MCAPVHTVISSFSPGFWRKAGLSFSRLAHAGVGTLTSPRLCIIIVAFFHFLGKELHSDLKQSVGSLLDFYARHGLAFTNTMFAYKVALTCICLGRKTVIYFFVLDTQMKKGVEVLSDHHLVVSWTRW